MKSKPKGAKYRNLTARSGVIYYQRRVNGKRIRFSCEENGVEPYRGPLLALVGWGATVAAHSDQNGGYQWQMTSEWRNGNSKIC